MIVRAAASALGWIALGVVPAGLFLARPGVLSRLFLPTVPGEARCSTQTAQFFGNHPRRRNVQASPTYLPPAAQNEWSSTQSGPFGGPQRLLALSVALHPSRRHRHSRLIAFSEHGVTFKWKDYRAQGP